MSDKTTPIASLAVLLKSQEVSSDAQSGGLVRGNSLGANSDHEAVMIWLNTHAKNPHTRKAYLQELRRFAVFMAHLRGKSLAGATVADLEAFRGWLSAPYRPEHGWPVGFVPFRTDDSGQWQGLSLGSRRRADTSIRGLYGFLHAAGYLEANPFLQLGKLTGEEISQEELARRGLTVREYALQQRRQAIRDDSLGQDKAFSFELWRWLRSFLDAPENTWQISANTSDDTDGLAGRASSPWSVERRARLRCILLFSYAAASRRSELAEATMNAIVRSGTRWVWKVVGKGRSAADGPDRVTLDDDAMNALQEYRLARGLSSWPESGEFEVPVIAKLSPKRRRRAVLKTGDCVTAGYINLELRRFFEFAAVFAASVNPAWGHSLQQAASHWLRHTRGSHFALGHVSLARTAEQLRHKDPRTTSRYYVHMKDEERGEAVDAVSKLLNF